MFIIIFLLVIMLVLGAIIYLVITDRTINFSLILLLIVGAIAGAAVSPFFFNLLWPVFLSSNWILLGAPPEGNAVRVALDDSTFPQCQEYVETDLGKIYHLQRDPHDWRSIKWVELVEVSSLQSYKVNRDNLDKYYCKPYIPRTLDRFVDVKIACGEFDFAGHLQALAVDGTGKISSLDLSYPAFLDPYLLSLVASLFLGGFLGFLATLFLNYLFNARHSTFHFKWSTRFNKIE